MDSILDPTEPTDIPVLGVNVPLHESVEVGVGRALNFIIESQRVGESETLLHIRLLSRPELQALIADFEALGNLQRGLIDLIESVHEWDEREDFMYEEVDATHALNFIIQAVRGGPAPTLKIMAQMSKADRVNLMACMIEFLDAINGYQSIIADTFDQTKEPWRAS